MQKTFIAFLDILGFSDLIDNNDDETISTIYSQIFNKSLGATFHQIYADEIALYKLEKPNVLIVSDSIILWTKQARTFDFFMISAFTALLMRNAIDAGIPLRGAILYDTIHELKLNSVTPNLDYFQAEINTASSILIGKGIVNAYHLERIQNWSGCIIDENCMMQTETMNFVTSNAINFLKKDSILFAEYLVPLKNAIKKTYTVLNWTNAITTTLSVNELQASFRKHNKNTESEDVQVKIKNTIEFFNEMKIKAE